MSTASAIRVARSSGGPVQPGGQVVEARRDVLDHDVDVELALPVGQLRMHLAGLGVDQPRLQHLAVAGEQGVGQRAVAPEDAVAVQVHEQVTPWRRTAAPGAWADPGAAA